MISKTTPQFWKQYEALPAEIRETALKAYALWQADPAHGSLHFKPLRGRDDLWSARVGRQYRALARRHGAVVVWVWIGHHTDYEHLLRTR